MQTRFLLGLTGLILMATTAQAGWEYTAVTKAEGAQHATLVNNSVHALIDGNKSLASGLEFLKFNKIRCLEQAVWGCFLCFCKIFEISLDRS